MALMPFESALTCLGPIFGLDVCLEVQGAIGIQGTWVTDLEGTVAGSKSATSEWHFM